MIGLSLEIGNLAQTSAANNDSAPPTIAHSIQGFGIAGQVLSVADYGTQSAADAHQWLADGVPITGADQTAYTVTPATEGTDITCQVAGIASSNHVRNWVPSDSATLHSWFDPADNAALTNIDGKVTELHSKNSAHVLNQLTASKQLSIVSGASGIQMLRSSHPEHKLEDLSYPLPDNKRFLAVGYCKAVTASSEFSSMYSMDGSRDFQVAAMAAGDDFRGGLRTTNIGGSGNTNADPWFSANGNRDFLAITRFMDGTRDGYLNGTRFYSSNYSSNMTSPNKLRLASNRSGTLGIEGDYGDLIIDDDFSDDTLRRYEGYMAHKFGIAAKLPIDHPYRTAPPVPIAIPT